MYGFYTAAFSLTSIFQTQNGGFFFLKFFLVEYLPWQQQFHSKKRSKKVNNALQQRKGYWWAVKLLCSVGKAEILIPKNAETAVFYNPVQEFNRDMSIAAINTWSEMYKEEITAKRLALKEKNLLKRDKKKTKTEDSMNKDGNADHVKSNAENQLNGDAETTEEEKQSKSVRIRVLEALSATGLRAIRYSKECPNVTQIIANDMDETAVEAIKRNIEHNNAGDKVVANQGDAK
jgi:tRNA (guanine26-N2/guanine27-N2)-dimethyltransferase